MNYSYLFPPVFKKIGWVLFVIFAVLNVLWMTGDIEGLLPACRVFSIWPDEGKFIMTNDDWTDEICIVGMILSLLFITFARLKQEDEYTINLRMKSMAWAVKGYGLIIMMTTLFVYGTNWLYIMLLSIYLVFFLFIIKFYYELEKFRKEVPHEE